MSWNEPGGSNKDPWSGQDRQPPSSSEVDEAIRSLQEKFGNLFGGGGFGLLAVVGLGVWALTGIYIVDEGTRGVVTRFGKYQETTDSGLHWHYPSPIENVETVNVENQRFVEVGYRSSGIRQQSAGAVPKEALMLTQDENIVDVRLAVQYQIKDAKEFLFNVRDPEATLKQVTESAERGVIGKSDMDFVLTKGRSEIAEEIKAELQQVLDGYKAGIRITSVNLQDAQPPEEVQGAFEDAIKAREDEQRLINEAETYRNDVIPKAKGTASRQGAEAEAYKQKVIARANGDASRFSKVLAEYEKAPEVMRKRLYLDAMQSVMHGSHTVLVDSKAGNNLVYLPLDKLTSGAAAGDSDESVKTVEPPASTLSSPIPVSESKPLRSSVRGREARGQ
ncbi:MAG: FtsH protease activity modulator HflK [Methylococcaceae bacterium]|nr:MAG: FtsH protease activity modulator HflK [Methylococcaceae bacterium]